MNIASNFLRMKAKAKCLFSSDNAEDLFRVAIVILNYNSEDDLQTCVKQILRQTGIHFSVILVDNGSRPESLEKINSWLISLKPNAVLGTEEFVRTWIRKNHEYARQSGRVYFVRNSLNAGYSAGNNIGIRIADELKADAVLIANPDMRIETVNYINVLSKNMLADLSNYIVASRIIDLKGNDQNPLREPTFSEELLWPFQRLIRKTSKQIPFVQPISGTEPVIVQKVSGCCLLLKMDFLRITNYLDEKVFLYCEEPILSARVHSLGGRIVYVPTITAIHAHTKSAKENASIRMLTFIKSRKYYLKTYSGYSCWQIKLLTISYMVRSFLFRVRVFFGW